jgi:hypothetical protein
VTIAGNTVDISTDLPPAAATFGLTSHTVSLFLNSTLESSTAIPSNNGALEHTTVTFGGPFDKTSLAADAVTFSTDGASDVLS